jgi:hypothetical protein
LEPQPDEVAVVPGSLVSSKVTEPAVQIVSAVAVKSATGGAEILTGATETWASPHSFIATIVTPYEFDEFKKVSPQLDSLNV